MRYLIIIFAIIGIAFGGWNYYITVESVCDTAIHQTLVMATRDDCSSGYDSGWDVLRPPFPPTGAMGYFYIDDPAYPAAEGLLGDYRNDAEIHLLWRIHYFTTLCGMIGDSCILKWSPDSLPDGTFKIITSMEDTGWRSPTSIDWGSALNMRTHSELGPFWLSEMAYINYTSPLAVAEVATPGDFAISAYPNPFNGNCRFMIDDLGLGIEAIEIYNVNGRMVEQIPSNNSVGAGFTPARDDGAGNNDRDGARPSPTEVIWQPADNLGSGVYLVRARFGKLSDRGEETVSKRVVYLK